MKDTTGGFGPVAPMPGSVEALQKLVDDLILIDLAGSVASDDGPLDPGYKATIQDLVAAEMRRKDTAPDLQPALTAALEKWAANS